jgi:hypothetical protein
MPSKERMGFKGEALFPCFTPDQYDPPSSPSHGACEQSIRWFVEWFDAKAECVTDAGINARKELLSQSDQMKLLEVKLTSVREHFVIFSKQLLADKKV